MSILGWLMMNKGEAMTGKVKFARTAGNLDMRFPVFVFVFVVVVVVVVVRLVARGFRS
jgi:hypothetical protein